MNQRQLQLFKAAIMLYADLGAEDKTQFVSRDSLPSSKPKPKKVQPKLPFASGDANKRFEDFLVLFTTDVVCHLFGLNKLTPQYSKYYQELLLDLHQGLSHSVR